MRRIVIILFCAVLSGGLLAQNATTADALFKQGDWPAALAQYKKLHRQDPANYIYTYRYARCLGELGRPDEAIPLFETVTNIVLKDFFIAREYYKVYRFGDAVIALDTYLANITPENERYEKAMALREKAETAARWLARTEDVSIYSVSTISSAHWRDSLCLSKDAGTITSNGEYRNARGDLRLFSDSLHHLYIQSRLMDEWEEPEQLPFDGINPFLATDGITIYYSQQSPDGLGGYDLYMSRLNTATHTFLQPAMLGMPYSSTGDDLFFAVDDASQQGLFVSALNDSTVQLFRFLPKDEKQYLRNADDATLRQMARRMKMTTDPSPAPASAASNGEEHLHSPLFDEESDVRLSSPLFEEDRKN